MGTKTKKNGKVAVVFAVVAIMFLYRSFAPAFAADFSEASYVANKALPAVVLVYSVLEYNARVYIPWYTGAEEYIVSDYIASMGQAFC